ncbi:hypothetical protein [Flaviaesturariibacter terrae]
MKNTFLGSIVGAGLLAALAVGCAPLQQSTGDDYYEPDPRVSTTAPSRIWVDDPYRPGASILMERDPFSGRYYPVSSGYGAYSPYGAGYPAPYGAYNPYPSRGGYRHQRSGGRGGYIQQTPQQQDQIRQQNDQRRQNAADRILGRKQ